MRLLKNKIDLKNDKGSVLMEAIVCLPVLLLLSLGVVQFAHIWYCRTIVHYAAYSAARAVLTAPNGADKELTAARSAAEIVCAPIAYMNPTDGTDFSLPGITPAAGTAVNSVIEGSGAVRFKQSNNSNHLNNVLQVSVSTPEDWHRQIDVKMKVPLLVPFVGPLIGKCIFLWTNGGLDPHVEPTRFRGLTQFYNEWTGRIELHERGVIVKPFISTWSDF